MDKFRNATTSRVVAYRTTAVEACRRTLCIVVITSATSLKSSLQGLSDFTRAVNSSGTTSSAEKNNVLDPEWHVGKAWPEGVAKQRGRKAWSEGVAERRGPKTCLPESRTWLQSATWGLQPGALAFSYMTVNPAYRRGFGADP